MKDAQLIGCEVLSHRILPKNFRKCVLIFLLFISIRIFSKNLDLESAPGVTLKFGCSIIKISEVSEKCDVSADMLRYYERIGLLPPVNRNNGGIRNYSELDIRRVEFIKSRGRDYPSNR